jgi:hypothetical protein
MEISTQDIRLHLEIPEPCHILLSLEVAELLLHTRHPLLEGDVFFAALRIQVNHITIIHVFLQ